MDLRWGFNNIRIREGDEEKAAFITLWGLFEPLVMQFGLCNAPSTFQRMVDEILSEEKGGGHVEVYIDDILIHTTEKEYAGSWDSPTTTGVSLKTTPRRLGLPRHTLFLLFLHHTRFASTGIWLSQDSHATHLLMTPNMTKHSHWWL
jgi:hypothetical protein